MKRSLRKSICIAIVAIVMTACLTGCDSSNYKKANELYDGGEFEAALSLYIELGEYEDAKERAAMCKYAMANTHFENKSYKEALDLYVELGNYEDCAEKIEICQREVGMAENADYDFLLNMEYSILDRMEKSNSGVVANSQLVNIELAYIEPFLQKDFYYDNLKVLAEKYVEGLYIQKEAIKQEIYSDYQVQWQRGMVLRFEVLKELYQEYAFLADHAEFVGTYIATCEDEQRKLQAYETIEADIMAQTTADGFAWQKNGYYVTCTLTNNTEYTFSTIFEMQYYDANNTQFDTGSAYIQDIGPGESYIVECYVSEPSKLVSYKWSNYYDEIYY